MNASKHLVRWRGRQSGPFGLEEIRAQLKNSDIGLLHEVQVEGHWMTVEKFLAQMAPRPAAPPPSRIEKTAPPPPVRTEEPKTPAPLSVAPPPPPPPAPPVPFFSLTPPMPVGQALPFTPAMSSLESMADETSGETLVYAGFWLRYVAAMLDGLIVGGISWAVGAVALTAFGATGAPLPLWLILLGLALNVVADWLYFAVMESAEIQATLGKLAVGLIVTDLAGDRITFSHASGRYFGKLVSTVTVGVGYFMAAFTDRKQALHDLMAGCYVLLRLPPERFFKP